MTDDNETPGPNWEKFVGKKEDVEARPVRDVMRHVERLGSPVHISPKIGDTGIYTIKLPPDVLRSVTNKDAKALLEKLDGSLIGTDPVLQDQYDAHGTQALTLWLERSALNAHIKDAGANGEHLRDMMKPFVESLQEKFHLPLYTFPFTHEDIINDSNPTPTAILLATDKEHQDVLHKDIVRYLGSQRRKAREDQGRDPSY